ncbi:MAG: hypothetical protein ABIU54_09150 [Candidatus Eisenbacteria bacterium]
MTLRSDIETQIPEPREPRAGFLSLKLRLWTACIASGVVAGLGSLWVLGTQGGPGVDAATLVGWLSVVSVASVITGFAMALWLDHHVVGQLRGLLRGVHNGRVWELRGLPAASGWGELSELGDALQGILATQRHSARAHEELEHVRRQMMLVQEALEHWVREESWVTPALDEGAVSDLAVALGTGLARRGSVEQQNREVAAQVARELLGSLADARESAEQSERGFVEATALLTTVRELQRLSGELTQALDALGQSPAASEVPSAGPREAARDALEELIAASSGSVEALGQGLMRVQDIHEHVQTIANRSTLIAIQVLTGERRGDAASELVARDLKQLALEVREATDRTGGFALDIETAVAEASARMRGVRERALAKLDALPETAASVPMASRTYDDAQRLLERVREMVQDAARKGERLSAAGERASRAAERLTRRLDEEGVELDALVVRLTPVGVRAAFSTSGPGLRLIAEERSAEPVPEDDAGGDDEDSGSRGGALREEDRP